MATEPEFKVGDKVRLTGRYWDEDTLPRGEVVTIEGIDSDGVPYFRDEEGTLLYVFPEGYGAELVKSEPKVGDKYRLTGERWESSAAAKRDLGGVGSVVEVDELVSGSARSKGWTLDGGGEWGTELVEDETSSKLVNNEPASELETLITDIGLTNEANGFNRTPGEARDSDYLSNKLLLMVSEIIEAHDEIRNGNSVENTYHTKDGKPEGFVSELADVFIRVLGTVHELGITEQFLEMVPEKLEYNKGRGFRHGKKF